MHNKDLIRRDVGRNHTPCWAQTTSWRGRATCPPGSADEPGGTSRLVAASRRGPGVCCTETTVAGSGIIAVRSWEPS
jgi:hypothetical protein